MKKILLGTMLCLTALASSVKAPDAGAACNRWLTRYFYPAGSSVACGYTYYYCEAASTHVGCTTPYYQDVHASCVCP